jgi:hypothetical protein
VLAHIQNAFVARQSGYERLFVVNRIKFNLIIGTQVVQQGIAEGTVFIGCADERNCPGIEHAKNIAHLHFPLRINIVFDVLIISKYFCLSS